VNLKEIEIKKEADAATRKAKEGAALLAAVPAGARIVVLDGNFADPARRTAARQAAMAAGARVIVLHVAIADAVARERLAARTARGASQSDAGIAEYELLRARFVAPLPSEGPLALLDGAAPVATGVATALATAIAI